MSRLARYAPLILLGLLLLMLGQGTGAADPPSAGGAPAAAPAIDTSLIPEDAVIAFVAYPRRVLAFPALAKADIKALSMADAMGDRFGFSLADVEQVMMLFLEPGAPVHGRLGRPNVAGVVFHLAKPHAGQEFAAKMMAPDKPEEVEIAGKKCFRPAKNQQSHYQRTSPCVCFPDERTIVVGDLVMLEKMLSANNVQTPLTEELRTLDPTVDAAIVVNNRNGTTLATLLKEAHLPESLAGLPEVLTTARLTVKAAPEVSLALELVGKDDDAAARLAKMVDAAKSLAENVLPALHDDLPKRLTADQKPIVEELLRLADKVASGLVPQRTRNQVAIQINGLTKIDDLATKVVLPAIDLARRVALRTQSANNVKQLLLAVFSYEVAHRRLPARAIFSKDGKPLLSWRVQMLPNLDEAALYKQFHLDEPWDSPNNKPLIAKMPSTFKVPGGKHNEEGRTCYVVPVGKDTVFDGETGTRLAQITDGTSKTIAMLQAPDDKSVFWTKPDDLEFDSDHPFAGLRTISDDAILAGFADGHVQWIRKDVEPEIFRRMIIRNDGLPVEPGKYQPN